VFYNKLIYQAVLATAISECLTGRDAHDDILTGGLKLMPCCMSVLMRLAVNTIIA